MIFPSDHNDDSILTVKQAQEILQCGKTKMYSIVGREDFPKHKVGSQYLIIKSELLNWIKHQ